MSLFPELEKQPPARGRKPGRPSPPASDEPPARAPGAGYLALARKYRPAQFDEVVGQDAVISTLTHAIEGGRLHHAYLFSGIRGVGKTTVARLFARALNCVEGPTPKPCGRCDACAEITSGLSLDVIELDAASNRGVDDVEPLREAARYAPSRDRNKVFILDEVHMLSNAAFNSLLKILEEPPPRIVWILATTEYRKVPPTVVSRCQHFEFRRVPRSLVGGYLKRIASAEGIEVDPQGIEILAASAGGSVRDAVSLLDQAIAYSGSRATAEDVRQAIGAIDRRLLVQFLALLAGRDAPGALEMIAQLAEGGIDFSQFASGLLSTIRDATVARFAPDAGRALEATEDEVRELRELGQTFNEDGLLRVFNALLDLPGALRGAPQPRFVLEAAALKLTRLADLTPIEDVLRDLRRGPEPGGSTSPAPPARGDGPAGQPTPPPSRAAGPAVRSDSTPVGGSPVSRPPAAGTPDSDLLERFLKAVQARKISLRTFLEAAGRIQVLDDRIRVEFAPRQSFFRESLATPESRAILREAALEAAGRTLEIEVAAGAAPAAESQASVATDPAGAGQGRRERLIQEALSRPGVKMVMDAFGGQIVDIREIT